jgi:hypothetical protein
MWKWGKRQFKLEKNNVDKNEVAGMGSGGMVGTA